MPYSLSKTLGTNICKQESTFISLLQLPFSSKASFVNQIMPNILVSLSLIPAVSLLAV